MNKYNSVKELRTAYAKHFIEVSGQELNDETLEREYYHAAHSEQHGFAAKKMFGVNSAAYIDGFGWCEL